MIRSSVHGWMRLAKDTPLGYLYAAVANGGLNIPSLSTSIPLQQISRFENLLSSGNPIYRALTDQPSFCKMMRRMKAPSRIGRMVVTSRGEAMNQWANLLYQSVDGRELDQQDIDRASYRWIDKPERVFPRLHLRGIQLRGGVLPTRSRRSRRARGRRDPTTDTRCRGGCNTPETINHILQKCVITHDGRCARYNRVMHVVEKRLRRGASEVWCEPTISTPISFIKPDIVLDDGRKLTIMDVSVVAGNRMEETWRLKMEKYGSIQNTSAILKWAIFCHFFKVGKLL